LKKNIDFIGLFDGHAGRIAARFCGDHLYKLVADSMKKSVSPLNALKSAFPETNKLFMQFLETADSSLKHAGTTGVAVIISSDGKSCFIGNVGDSRAVLSRGGKGLRLSYDHKPYNEEEEERIRVLGGCVTGDTGRVNGQLAVSRAIGDFYMQPYVSDEPFLNEIALTDEDKFVILACDGVWDVITDQRAVEIVEGEKDPFIASSRLRDYAYLLGSDDNISVITVVLK